MIGTWPPPVILALRIAWLAGKTPLSIARELGPPFTRADVLAKVDELDLDSLRMRAVERFEIPEKRPAMFQCKAAREARMNGVPFPERTVLPGNNKPLGTPRAKRRDAGIPRGSDHDRGLALFTHDEISELARFPDRVPGPIGEISAVPFACHAIDDLDVRHGEPDKCRWPLGEPGTPNFRFCCGKALGEQSIGPAIPYCAGHARMAYQPSQPRRSIVPRPKAFA